MRQSYRQRNSQQGQTLIVALLILGVLLVLGAVFAAILSRTIRSTTVAKQRGQNNDFAEAGIRVAHGQLVNSEAGADWRVIPTVVTETAPDFTRDADAHYVRPPATSGGAPLLYPGSSRIDQGGPDGLGPYGRYDYRGGRALVRVRYAPGDPSIFQSQGVGYLRNTGLARNYLIIESVGRQGEVKVNDPSQAGTRGAVQYRNYASQATFELELAKIKGFDEREISSRKLIAFAQIGLIDYARFVSNKYRSSKPVEFGIPEDVGTRYREVPGSAGVAIETPVQTGGLMPSFALTPTGVGAALPGQIPGNGSIRINGDARFNGNMILNLNQTFGDQVLVSGAIGAGNPTASMTVNVSRWDQGTNSWLVAPQSPVLNSSSPSFTTLNGLIRDGSTTPDGNSNARSASYLPPPTILANSDNSENANVSRYQKLTRDSGRALGSNNSGLYGHGEGVFVDNGSDFQVPDDEEGRRAVGGQASMVQDWLSPFGDGVQFRSGWHGPFYIPVGAFLHLQRDGFVISRNAHPDQEPTERTWKRSDGSDSGLTSIKYRVGIASDGAIHVVNTLTPGLTNPINGALTVADYDLGERFNGVLYFEGNVRVRGVIPTDVQMTVVSNKTVYIEGSILKGVEANDVTAQYPAAVVNNRLIRPSRSAVMLMAKDYVTLNPTMFFGPSSETDAQVERGGQGVAGYNPVKLSAPNGATTLQFETPLSDRDPANPSAFLPVGQHLPTPLSYYEFDPAAPANPAGTGARVNTNLLLSQALEFTNPGPSNVYYGMHVNRSLAGNSEYQFETLGSRTNTAQIIWATINNPAPAPAFGNIYGLGTEPFQQSPKFETVRVPVISPADVTPNIALNQMLNTFDTNNYVLKMQGTNSLELFLTQFGSQSSGNYLLARAAAVPMDIKIEASIYAEEGSFFVIPGDWFNPNPNDRRDRFEQRVVDLIPTAGSAAQARIQAAQERLENFGSTMYAPFYGEPIDVKISLVGSIAENMPPPMAQQSEWLKKWGWMPTRQAGVFNAGTGARRNIPWSHVSDWTKSNPATRPFTENLIVSYDPVLATGRVNGYGFDSNADAANPLNGNVAVRTETMNGVTYSLPPMPKLPVSPALAYFGEVK
jgi:hypothetical protein